MGEKEQLADIIYKIDSDETPIFSMAKKETVNGTLVEWQTQELASAGQNSLSEGADATYATPTATVRLNNYTQISGKDFAISGTLESVDKAGRAKETAYQSVLKGQVQQCVICKIPYWAKYSSSETCSGTCRNKKSKGSM